MQFPSNASGGDHKNKRKKAVKKLLKELRDAGILDKDEVKAINKCVKDATKKVKKDDNDDDD